MSLSLLVLPLSATYEATVGLYVDSACTTRLITDGVTSEIETLSTDTDSVNEAGGMCEDDTKFYCVSATQLRVQGFDQETGEPPCSGEMVFEGTFTEEACASLPIVVPHGNPGDVSKKQLYVYMSGLKGCTGTAVALPPPPPKPPSPPPTVGSSSDDDPCFGRDTTTVCRVSPGTTPAEALRQCTGGGGTTAEKVLMTALSAGDVVLADEVSLTRVVVNQHVPSEATSTFVTLHHADGALVLTPDHVILLDGEWAPARNAKPGSLLSNGKEVTAVTAKVEGIINPLTSAGTILANGVVASVYPEWIHSHMHASKVYPLPISVCNLLSYLFPQNVQAFYDTALEPTFSGGNRGYLEAVPPALVTPAVAAFDAIIAASFLAAPALLATGAAALVARKA